MYVYIDKHECIGSLNDPRPQLMMEPSRILVLVACLSAVESIGQGPVNKKLCSIFCGWKETGRGYMKQTNMKNIEPKVLCWLCNKATKKTTVGTTTESTPKTTMTTPSTTGTTTTPEITMTTTSATTTMTTPETTTTSTPSTVMTSTIPETTTTTPSVTTMTMPPATTTATMPETPTTITPATTAGPVPTTTAPP